MGDKFVPRGINFVTGEKFVPRRTNLSPMAEFCPGPTQRLREATSGVKIVPFCIPNGFGVKKTFGCMIGAPHSANFSWQICSPGDKFVPRRRILSPDLPVIPRSHINERNCSFLSSQWICSPKITNLGSILCSGGQNLSPGGQNLSPGFLIENQLIRSPNCISEASVIKTITNNGNFRIFFGHANFQIFD